MTNKPYTPSGNRWQKKSTVAGKPNSSLMPQCRLSRTWTQAAISHSITPMANV